MVSYDLQMIITFETAIDLFICYRITKNEMHNTLFHISRTISMIVDGFYFYENKSNEGMLKIK